eukprot:6929056-Pyramimonas_sp.AAC.1
MDWPIVLAQAIENWPSDAPSILPQWLEWWLRWRRPLVCPKCVQWLPLSLQWVSMLLQRLPPASCSYSDGVPRIAQISGVEQSR